MSDLSDLTGSGVNNTIPGYPLTRMNLTSIASVEVSIQGMEVERSILRSQAFHPDLRVKYVNEVRKDSAFFYVYGRQAFRQKLDAAEGMFFSLLASAQINNKNVAQDGLSVAIDKIPVDVIRKTVAWVWGWDQPDPKSDVGGEPKVT